MRAKILGFIDLDEFVPPAEVETILNFEYTDTYSEYVFGVWRSCVLLNGSGAHLDSEIHEYEGNAQQTALVANLPGVQSLLHSCFAVDRIKWVRVFKQDRGFLLPHVDFVGMHEGFIRLHVPLRTSPTCMHSEENVVYHMRRGEIWYVEAARVHSSGNLSGAARASLCIDFSVHGPVESLVRPAFRVKEATREPHVIQRRPFTDRDKLAALGKVLRVDTFDAVVAELIRIHFERDVHAGAMFDWLADMAVASQNPELKERARKLRELALGS